MPKSAMRVYIVFAGSGPILLHTTLAAHNLDLQLLVFGLQFAHFINIASQLRRVDLDQ